MPEVTETKIRIPVSECKITATIDISSKDGIQALYCGKEKQIATYLFDTEKWTMGEAREWIKEHGKSLTKAASIEKKAIPYKKTPLDESGEWDAGAEVKSATVDDLKIICTIMEGDPENKTSYKLPHHRAGGEHTCVWRAVINCAAVLMGARGGVDASPESIAGAKRHIASHYKDFEKGEPPWLKKEEKTEKSWEVPIFKAEEERFVYGIVLQPDIEDAQGDIVSKEEIAKSAHQFMENCQAIGVQHNVIVPQIKIWESYLTPQDMTIAGQSVIKGSWILGVHILDDDVWDQVKKGELTGFSIKGWGTRSE